MLCVVFVDGVVDVVDVVDVAGAVGIGVFMLT